MCTMYDRIINFVRDLYDEPEAVIPLHRPCFSGREKELLIDCVDSTYVSSVGEYVDAFERATEAFTGCRKAVACVNGTSALYLALKLMGVSYEHEVVTQPLTFVATANAIAWCGAKPVFADVDAETLGLSPDALRRWLSENVKGGGHGRCPVNKRTGRSVVACVPVHTFGHPCRIDEIVSICREHGIAVVEDAAESLGSVYKGRHTGLFGDVGVLSFNGNKIVTSGGGGMLLFGDRSLADRARHLSSQARIPHEWEYAHDEIGYNFRMPNINAALGLAQMEQIDGFLESKRTLAHAYEDFFSALPCVFVREPSDGQSNHWLNAVKFSGQAERDAFLDYSNKNGVTTRPAWRLMTRLPMYADCQIGDLSQAIRLEEQLVNLPSSVRI